MKAAYLVGNKTIAYCEEEALNLLEDHRQRVDRGYMIASKEDAWTGTFITESGFEVKIIDGYVKGVIA